MSAPAKASVLHTIKTVAWSFLGIRKRSGFEDDLAKLSPLQVIAVGLLTVLLFVVSLMFFVSWVVAK